MEPGTVIADRFEIERLVQSGGMGDVYFARDRVSGEPVALKTTHPDPALRERFAREANVLADLKHPAIVRYVAHGATPAGELYLAMEWLRGEDLAERLAYGSLDVRETLVLGIRLADALAFAHERGLVHRDIKPSNVFLPDGNPDAVKLLDFGIVRATRSVAHTQAGLVVGTPGYMSPEQARGSGDVDARTDVFALGCVLFECLAGRPLFVADDVVALQIKIVIEEAPLIGSLREGIPRSFERLLARMVAKDKADRPESGAALAHALRALAVETTSRTVLPSSKNLPASGITGGEQRLFAAVVARLVAPRGSVRPDAATLATEEIKVPLDALAVAVRAFGTRLEILGDGSLVVALDGAGTATDLASRAARCALTMREIAPNVAMALATGRGEAGGRVPVGDVIDRAARLLALAEAGARAAPVHEVHPIRIDELTAGLLDARFVVDGENAARFLHGARDASGGRTLLGKATPCVGRAREIGTLQAIFEQCVDEGIAQVVLVEGVEGIGKTRVRSEWLERVRSHAAEPEIWIGQGDPLSAGAPFAILAQALRRGLGLASSEAPEVKRAKLRARIARHELVAKDRERLLTFLSELLGIGARDEHEPMLHAALQDPMLMGDQMRLAFEDFLAAESRVRPVVLVLEDLQWGDAPSIQYVDGALRRTTDRALLVLATARPDVHQLFPTLWSERSMTRLRLGELPKKASALLVRSVLGESTAEDVVTRLVERAAGNPFFLEELVRAYGERGATEGDLPETVLAMVQTRIEELPAESRRVLRAASVFGLVFRATGVAAVLGEASPAKLDDWLTHLAEREMIVRRGDASYPGDREYAFRHVLLQQAAYAMFIEEDRALGHRLAGEWLERAGERNAVVLAEHFERGHAPDRALVWYLRAAEQALEGNEHAAVLARVERALACEPVGETLGALRLLQSDAYRWLADYAQAESYARKAMSHLPRGSAAWLNAAGNVCIASSLRGDVSALVDVANTLACLPDSKDALALQVVAWARATAWLMRHDEIALADELLERIEAGVCKLGEGDAVVMARVHYARAGRALHDGRLDRYLALSEAAAERFEQAGMLRNLCVQRKTVALANLCLGRTAAAEESLRLALADGDKLSLRDNAADARDLLGTALARRGLLDEALELVEGSVSEAIGRGGKWVEGRARTTLAGVLFLRGEHARAEGEARAALAVLPEGHPQRGVALAWLGRILVARGEGPAALVATREAFDLVSRGRGTDHEIAIRLAHLEAMRATKHPEATAFAEASRAALMGRADKIASTSLREGFLRDVPENVELLAQTGAPD